MTADNINVAIRVRPFIKRETLKQATVSWAVNNQSIYQIDENGLPVNEPFSFDHIYTDNKTNKDIYDGTVFQLVKSALEGFNSTVFAYGQTSSGKTHTMLGSHACAGIMQLAISDLFTIIAKDKDRKYLVRVCYMEIYNEKVNDLLDINAKDLRMREDKNGNHNVNAKEIVVMCPNEVFELMKEGNKNRKIGCTDMNEKSSRSHSILRITIESTLINSSSDACTTASINFVDLAGSERIAQTKSEGARLKEGLHINKSLSTLGLVIKQLSENEKFINFRDSKLTKLLQNSLGGNAKTLIIATVTVASTDETLSTLSFAQRAKAVKNQPIINKVITDQEKIKQYARLSAEYKGQLEQELAKNEELQKETNDRNKLIKELQKKLNCIESFHGKKQEMPSKVPNRRHTISAQGGFKLPLPMQVNRIITPQVPRRTVKRSEAEPSDNDDVFFISPSRSLQSIGEVCELEELPENTDDAPPDMTDKIRELETTLFLKEQQIFELNEKIDQLSAKTPVQTPIQTPYKVLKQRVRKLEEEYAELAEFTKLEEESQTMNLSEDYKVKISEMEKTICSLTEKQEVKILEMQKSMDKLTKENKSLKEQQVQMSTDHVVVQEVQSANFKKRETMLLNLISDLEKSSPLHESFSKLAQIKDKYAAQVESQEKEIENLKAAIAHKDSVIKEKDQIILEYDEKVLEESEEPGKGTNISSLEVSFHKSFSVEEEDCNNEKEMRLFKMQDEIYALKNNLDKERKSKENAVNALSHKLKEIEETNSLNLSLENDIRSNKFQMEKLISEISSIEQDKENRDFNESKVSFEIGLKNKEINDIQSKLNDAQKNSTKKVNEKIKSLVGQSIAILESLKSTEKSPPASTPLKNSISDCQTEKLKQIEDLKNSIEEKNQIINTKDEESHNAVKVLQEEISSLQKFNEDKNQEIEELQKSHTTLEEQVNCLNELINEQNTEGNTISSQITDLKKSLEEKDHELQGIEDLRKSHTKLEEQVNYLNKLIDEKNTEVNTISSQIIDLKKSLEEKDRELQEIEELQKSNTTLKEQVNCLNKLIDEQNTELDTISSQMTDLKKSLQEKDRKLQEIEELQKSHTTLEEQVNCLNKLVEEKNTEVDTISSQITDLKKSLEEKDRELQGIEELQKSHTTLEEQVNCLNKLIDEKNTEVDTISSQITDLKKSLEEKDHELQGIEEFQKSRTTLEEQVNCLNKLIEEKNTEVDTISSQMTDLKKSLEEKDRENGNLMKCLKALQNVYINALEELGKKWTYGDQLEENRKLTEEIHNRNMNELYKVIDSKERKFEEFLEEMCHLDGMVKELSEKDETNEMKIHDLQSLIERLNKELTELNLNEEEREFARKWTKEVREFKKCNKIRELTTRIDELTNDLEERNRQIEGYNSTITELNENLSEKEELLGELTEKRIEIEELIQKNQDSEKEKDEVIEQLNDMTKKIDMLRVENKDLFDKLENLNSGLGVSSTKHQEDQAAETAACIRKIEELNAELTKFEINNNELSCNNQQLAAEKEELLQKINLLKNESELRNNKMLSQIDELTSKNSELLGKIDQLKAELDKNLEKEGLLNKIDQLNEELGNSLKVFKDVQEKLNSEKRELQDSIEKQNSEKEELLSKIDRLSSEVALKESVIEQLTYQVASLEQFKIAEKAECIHQVEQLALEKEELLQKIYLLKNKSESQIEELTSKNSELLVKIDQLNAELDNNEEIDRLHTLIKNHTAEKEGLLNKIDQLDDELSNLLKGFKDLEKKLNMEKRELQEIIEKQNLEKEELLSKMDHLSSEVASKESVIEQLTSQVASLEQLKMAEKAVYIHQVEQLVFEKEELLQKLNLLKNKSELGTNEMLSQIEELTSKNSEIMDKIDLLNADLDNSEEIDKLNTLIKNLTTEKEDQLNIIDQLNDQLSNLLKGFKDLEKKLNLEKRELQEIIEKQNSEKEELLSKMDHLSSEVASKESVIEQFTSQVASLEQFKIESVAQLEEKNNEIRNLNSKIDPLISTEKKYQEIISELKLNSETVIDDQRKQIEEMSRELEELKNGEEQQKAKKYLAIVKDYKKRLETECEEHAKIISDLKAKNLDLLKEKINMAMQSSKCIEDLCKEEKEKKQLEEEYKTVEQMYKAFKHKYHESVEKEKNLTEEVKMLISKCKDKDEKIADLMKTRSSRSPTPQELRKMKRQNLQDKSRSDVLSTCESCKNYQEDILRMTEQVEKGNKKIQEMQEKLESRTSLNTSKELTRARRQSTHDRHRSLNSSLDCDKCENEIPRLNFLLETKDKKIADLVIENRKLQELENGLKQKYEALKQHLHEKVQQIKTLERTFTPKECQNCIELNTKNSLLAKSSKEEVETLKSKLSEMEIKYQERNKKYEDCKKYFLHYQKLAQAKQCDCKTKYDPIIKEKTDKITTLEEQIETMEAKCANLTKISRMRRQELAKLKSKLGMDETEEVV